MQSRVLASSLAFALLALCTWPPPAAALDPGKTLYQYSHGQWRTEDGLP